jgi:hypothetical protein
MCFAVPGRARVHRGRVGFSRPEEQAITESGCSRVAVDGAAGSESYAILSSDSPGQGVPATVLEEMCAASS